MYIFIYLYLDTKNQDISPFFSENIVHFKILQSGWSRAFWPLYNFLQIWDLYRDITNNINFHFGANLEKITSKFIYKFKKICFCPIFGSFLGEKKYLTVRNNFIWLSTKMPKFKKN